MRILLVGSSFSGGGAERRFKNIATQLFKGKVDVAVLTPCRLTGMESGGQVFCLNWKGRFSYPKVIWLLRQRFKNNQYEVVMAFGLFPCLISILANFSLIGNRKLIISEITRPKSEAQNSRIWRRLLYNALRKIFYKHGDLITANSIDGLRETCELAGIPIEQGVRVVNVVNNILLTKCAMEKTSIPLPEGKYVICVGRLAFMKRIDTVISAFGILTNRLECKLVIVGDGEARQALEEQTNTLGLQDSVLFLGKLENPFPVLRRAAAFVLASEYEGFSNSVLEAMFCDVPVITSLCSSDAQDMCHQRATLGFEVGDYQQLAKHLVEVLTEDKLSQELIRCARMYRAPHAMENAIPFYENLICKLAYAADKPQMKAI